MKLPKGRLEKLEQQYVGDSITVKLRSGGQAMLPSRGLLRVFMDVLEDRDTPETRIALAAEPSDEQRNLIVLMQMVARSREVVLESMPNGSQRVQ